jgi:hypothetical protein
MILVSDMAQGPIRKEQRIGGVVPVRISSINEDGEPVQCLAHTLNVSRRGARLAGVTLTLRLGTVVRITRGRSTSNFKIVWVGPNQQIGVEALETISNFWGLEQLGPVSADTEQEHSKKRTK